MPGTYQKYEKGIIMRVVLASGSPRRKELLHRVFDEFEIITSKIDEREIENKIEDKMKGQSCIEIANAMVSELSKQKALDVFNNLDNQDDVMVIGADTTVVLSDEILGKPIDRDDAVRMLRKESLEDQKVITGVSLVCNDKTKTFTETAIVKFYKLDAAQEQRIQEYCDTKDPYDKAGAYGIQALGDKLVESYEGEFENIIGLPVSRLKNELKSF